MKKMQLADTRLGRTINPGNSNHDLSFRYLGLVGEDEETFVPLTSVIEFDLVMKGRKYTSSQRKDAFGWLAHMVPSVKIAFNSVVYMREAIKLQESGMGYFDSLIAGLAIERNAAVLTTDKEISKITRTKW